MLNLIMAFIFDGQYELLTIFVTNMLAAYKAECKELFMESMYWFYFKDYVPLFNAEFDRIIQRLLVINCDYQKTMSEIKDLEGKTSATDADGFNMVPKHGDVNKLKHARHRLRKLMHEIWDLHDQFNRMFDRTNARIFNSMDPYADYMREAITAEQLDKMLGSKKYRQYSHIFIEDGVIYGTY